MKRIKMGAPHGAPAVQGVEVTKFSPPSPPHIGQPATEAETGFGKPLPPPPPQMNAPVGPPPPAPELPTDFEGYVRLAKAVSRGSMTDKAMIWVGLAQATAVNNLSFQVQGIEQSLGEFLDFLGAGDGDTDGGSRRLSDEGADAIIVAVEHMLESVGVTGEVAEKLKAAFAARVMEEEK